MLAAAGQLGRRGLALTTHVMGPSAPMPTLLLQVRTPAAAAAGEAVTFLAEVDCQAAGKTTIQVADEGGETIARQTVSLTLGQAEIPLLIRPDAPGLRCYQVSLDDQTITAGLQVRRTVVGVVESAPDAPAAETLRKLLGENAEVKPLTSADLTNGGLATIDVLALADTPAAELPVASQRKLRGWVENGGGLLVTGGRNAFGPGGYGTSELAPMLPLRFPQQKEVRDPGSALAVIIDTSGSMGGEGVNLAKEVARLALKRLKPHDKAGIVEFHGAKRWAAPMQPAGNSIAIQRALDRLSAGGGTVMLPAIEEAYYAMLNVTARTKHVLVLTDGGVEQGAFESLLRRMADDGIHVSTVLVGPRAGSTFLSQLAAWGRGQFYTAPSRFKLPEIIVKQPSSSLLDPFVESETALKPVMASRLTRDFRFENAPKLRGYVKTKAKDTAELLLQSDLGDPVLARWNYGLGRVAVLTTSLGGDWARDFLGWSSAPPLMANLTRQLAGVSSREPLCLTIHQERAGLGIDIRALSADPSLADAPLRVVVKDANDAIITTQDIMPVRAHHWNGNLENLPAGASLIEVRDAAGESVLATAGVVVPPPDEFPRAGPDRDKLEAATRIARDFAARAGAAPTPLRTRELWPLCAALGLVCFLLMILARRLPSITRLGSAPALRALAFFFVVASFGSECPAQVATPPGETAAPMVSQDFIAKNVGGLPVLRCKVRHGLHSIDAHLLFDLSMTVPFQIHKSSLGGLDLNAGSAIGQKVDIVFPNGIELMGIPIECERYLFLETQTRLHAKDLDEVPLVGFIGPAAFKSNVIELDMAKELLRTMGVATDQAQKLEMPYELMSCGIVVNGTGPAEAPVRAVLTTRSHDTVLAPPMLKLARDRSAKPNTLNIGKVAWGERSAIRFESLDMKWPPDVNAVIGTDALSNATVTLWPKRNRLAIQPGLTAPFPDLEQQYFLAVADHDADAVMKFIHAGPRRRLLDEACLKHWEILIADDGSSPVDLKSALDTIAAKYSQDRSCETLLDTADKLEKTEREHREELVKHALDLAVLQSSKAVEQTAIHDVHVRIGRRAFAKGDLPLARRHLLSAAFGMPKNAECNFWLGEVYRESGKPLRAWSRYFQAILDEMLLKEDPLRAQALERLTTLNNDPEFRKTFDMPEAEGYMAGRMPASEFHAETRYRFVRDRYPHHARMVELFVDSSGKLGGGMQLAFQALAEFFQNEIVLISWHLDDPMHSEASRKRLATYLEKSAPLCVIDGKPMFDTAHGSGERIAEDAAIHYPPLRDACLSETAHVPSGWEIKGNLHADRDRLKLGVSVAGGESPEGLRMVVALCERSVMDVGNNGVFFHHHVARDLLTPADGLALDQVMKQPLDLVIDVAELRDRIGAALPEKYRTAAKGGAPYIDAKQLVAVAFVQRSADSAILAAETFPISESP
jgi:hypothetical protein